MHLLRFLDPSYVYKNRALVPLRLEMEQRRFRAMLRLALTANDVALSRLRNIHSGQRAFVIGNGPSLLVSDLARLQGELTFAANKIWLAFEKTSWRPTYYLVEDDLVAEQNTGRIAALAGVKKLLPTRLKAHMPPVADATYFNLMIRPFYPDLPRFGTDPRKMLYWGSTVVYTHLQLAFYMGIREIYLIGVDFSFDVTAHTEETDTKKVLVAAGESNHFHPEYRLPGERWNLPNLDLQEKAFEQARRVFKMAGGRVINATRGGRLEILPRADLDRILA